MDSYLGLVQQFHIGYKPYSTFINDCVKAIGKPRLNIILRLSRWLKLKNILIIWP